MLRWLLPPLTGALVFAPVLLAQETPQPRAEVLPFGGRNEMNGYKLEDYKEFLQNWRFVTVRYRKDTGEMRWTYANETAWKALLVGGTDYPDGSVFVKIGIGTLEDPDFTSSAVPSGAKRFQLMVKDAQKHADTDGWGYALFDGSGFTFDEEPVKQAKACHACHEYVRHRDYVFSQVSNLDVGPIASTTAQISPGGVTFLTAAVTELPLEAQRVLPPDVREVRLVNGPLRKHMFQGTIDEIRPALAKEALASKLPAALVNERGDRFSIVLPEASPGHQCPELKGGKTVPLTAHYTIKPPGTGELYPVVSMALCEAVR